MPDAGVIYFNRGTKCLVRLGVSIYSLRQHYKGPVTIMHEGPLDSPFEGWARSQDVDILRLADSDVPVLVRKASLWREMPYDAAVYLDADTLVQADIRPLLELTQQHGFVATQFSNWQTTGRRISGRIREWAKVDRNLVEPALRYGPAVNSGVMGWSKGAAILPTWEDLTRRGHAAGCNRLVLDEVALQLLLPHHPHHTTNNRWNASGAYDRTESAAIIHYHGRKHVRETAACERWKQAYWELRNTSNWHHLFADARGDARLNRYLNSACRRDITIVTAVTPSYWQRLQRNMTAWMKTPGLREQQYLVFVHGFKSKSDRAWLSRWKNVRVQRWDFPAAGDNLRERMLSAFVFGVARQVSTPYWMKLDADQSPGERFNFPDYHNATVVAHRWGYTRVKSDPGATKHWLNSLDEWWGGEPMFPTNLPVDGKYCHPRTMSQWAIEKTAFTRQLAARCGSRLPVPSQDTTSWYAATALKEPILRINMKSRGATA